MGRIAFHASRKVWLSNFGSLGPSENAWPEICPHRGGSLRLAGVEAANVPKTAPGAQIGFPTTAFECGFPYLAAGLARAEANVPDYGYAVVPSSAKWRPCWLVVVVAGRLP